MDKHSHHHLENNIASMLTDISPIAETLNTLDEDCVHMDSDF